jgi:glycosyltransferase involved in cell wall biosynthesis
LVVDDGSTDGTADVVAEFGSDVAYIQQEPSGVSVARNRGASIARGELLAFLDHDDMWLPNKLALQVEMVDRERSAMTLCGVTLTDDSGHREGGKRLQARDDLLTGMLLFDGTEAVSCSSTGLIDREWFVAHGGFDPNIAICEDWDLFMRALMDGGISYVDEELVLYRIHATNSSRNIGLMEANMLKAFAKTFADPRLPPRARAVERQAYGGLYRMLAGSYRDAGRWASAVRCVGRATWHDPRVAINLVRPSRSGTR